MFIYFWTFLFSFRSVFNIFKHFRFVLLSKQFDIEALLSKNLYYRWHPYPAVLHLACTSLLQSTIPMTQTVQRNGLSVQRACTVPLDCWSAEITGTLDSQSSGELFNLQHCTMPQDCWSTEITGTYAGLSVCEEYWSKDQLELKIRGQYCSKRLFRGQ